jgi:hypothetical protein
MDFLALYPQLKGSHGQVRVRLNQRMLDRLCEVVKASLPPQVKGIRIIPSGTNRFRIFAELSNELLSWFGQFFLTVLGDKGLEIQLDRTTAVPGVPFLGRLTTSVVGQSVIARLVDLINDQLGAQVMQVNYEFLGETRITLDPFALLHRFAPAGVERHVPLVQWQITTDSFFVDFNWLHTG